MEAFHAPQCFPGWVYLERNIDMKNNPFFHAVIVICTASCSLAAKPATMTVMETAILPTDLPAATDTPTATPVPPTDTATASATLTPPLSANGPYLAYWTEAPEGGRQLTMLNADSSERSVIPLPERADPGAVSKTLSPNGEWLAFHTGYDELTLKLMHLPDGKVITVSKLLSADFPENFDALARDLIAHDRYYAGAEDVEEVKQAIVNLFMMGIKDLDWSPNSRYLAFAGQMDGLSSDLYVFDTVARTIRRMTDGPGQITGWIDWSPNGKWIFHASTNTPMMVQWAPGIFAASLDGSEVKNLGGTMYYGGWISPDTIIASEAANGMGIYYVTTTNVETGARTVLWKDSFSDYAVADDGRVAVCGRRNLYEYPEPGLYVFHLDGRRELIKPGFLGSNECRNLAFRGAGPHLLILAGPDGILGISQKGETTVIRPEDGRNVVSPDHKWMLLACDDYGHPVCALDLYDENDVFVRQLAFAQMETIFWSPDSLDVYFNTGDALFHVSLPDGEPVLVEEHLKLNLAGGMFEDLDFKWLP
jgi:hypothetical protein